MSTTQGGQLAQPATLETSGEAIIQGDSVWCRESDDIWHVEKGEVIKGRTRITVVSSGVCKTYLPGSNEGCIGDGASNPLLGSADVRFVLSGFVSATASALILGAPNTQILRREHRDEGSVVVVGDTDFNVSRSGGMRRLGATRVESVLAPALGYQMIERVVMNPDGRRVYELRVDYVESQEFGHIPDSIRITVFSRRTPDLIASVACVKYKMRFNEMVDPAVFDLAFPGGTRVRDAQLGIRYIVGPTDLPDDASRWVEEVHREAVPK